MTIHYSVGFPGESYTPDRLDGPNGVRGSLFRHSSLIVTFVLSILTKNVRNSYKLTVFQKAKSSNNNSVYYYYRNFYAGTPIVGQFQK